MDGILRVNKPKGLTSHDVVARARRSLGMKEVGHAGTLDPMADGLLILLLGQATKLSDLILNGDKAYQARVLLGMETDTWDLEGEITQKLECKIQPESFPAALSQLKGEFQWEVPKYSAIKQQGKKLYEKARSGEDFEAPKRNMRFSKVELIEASQNEVEVFLQCSKGSYIRSWARQLGAVLGVPSCLSALTRCISEPFSLKGAMELEELETLSEDEVRASEAFSELRECLPQLPGFSLIGRDLKLMSNGQIPNALVRRLLPLQKDCNRRGESQFIRIFAAPSSHLLALLEVRPRASVRTKRIFKTP